MTEEKKVSTEIKVIDLRDDVNRLSEYKDKVKALEVHRKLKIIGVDDKEGAKLVRAARIECKKIIASIETDRKKVKAPVLELGKNIDAKAEEYAEVAKGVKTYLEEEEKAITDELAAIAEAEALKADIEKHRRINALNSLGVTYTGISYTVGDTQIMTLELEEFSDEDFKARFTEMEIEDNLIKEGEAERKRLEQVESDRLAKEKADQEAKQAEIDAQLKELAEIKAGQARKADELKAEELRIKQAKQAAKDAEKAKADAEKQRIADAKKAEADKVKAVEDAKIAEREKIEAARIEEVAKENEMLKEAERLARLAPDKDKLSIFLIELEKLSVPELSTTEGKKAGDTINGQLDKMQAWVVGVIEKL